MPNICASAASIRSTVISRLHRVPGYRVTEGSFPNADYAADHTLCLPLHQSLTDEELALIVDTIHEFGAKFC